MNPSTKYTTFAKDCAIFAEEAGLSGPVIAAGKTFGAGPWKISARIVVSKARDADPWMGIQLDIPLGDNQERNEQAGFGVRYICKSSPSLPYPFCQRSDICFSNK